MFYCIAAMLSHAIYFRLLLEVIGGTAIDHFSFLVEEISNISGIVMSHGAQISMLSDELMATRASHAEEMDGRINTDNLNHLMILGGPYLEGDDLQVRLKQQV